MIMKVRALCDVLVSGKRHEAFEVFEVSPEEARVLIEYGWAVELKEEPKPRKKKTKE